MKEINLKKQSLTNNTLLQSITTLHSNHVNIFNEVSKIKTYKNELKTVCEFFDIEHQTGVLLSVIICDQLIGEVRYIHKVLKSIGFSSIEIISLKTNINELLKRGWLKQSHRTFPYEREKKIKTTEYIVSQQIINAVMCCDKTSLENERPLDFTDGLIKLRNYIKHLVECDLFIEDVYEGIQNYLIDFN